MVSRTYYLPRNQLARYLLNRIFVKYECSYGDIRPVAGTLRVPITCKEKDVKYIEAILRNYGMIGGEENE